MLAAFLDKDRNHDFRISFGRVSDEPGVGLKFLLLSEAIPCVVAMTCAVPDFPLSSTPASFNCVPVPPLSLTTPYIASVDFFDRRFRNPTRSSPTFCASFIRCGLLEDATRGNAAN